MSRELLFVSYTTKDDLINKEVLQFIYDKMSSDINVYIDLLHNECSSKHQEEIFNNILNCEYFVCIVTPFVFYSDWVAKEIEFAQNIGKTVQYVDYENPKQIINALNNALNANRHQTQPAKPTQAAACVSAPVSVH